MKKIVSMLFVMLFCSGAVFASGIVSEELFLDKLNKANAAIEGAFDVGCEGNDVYTEDHAGNIWRNLVKEGGIGKFVQVRNTMTELLRIGQELLDTRKKKTLKELFPDKIGWIQGVNGDVYHMVCMVRICEKVQRKKNRNCNRLMNLCDELQHLQIMMDILIDGHCETDC